MPAAAMLFSAIVVVALGARVLLDLTGIAKPGLRLDVPYAALFAVAGAALLIHDSSDPFGYAGLGLCGFYGIKALVFAVRKGRAEE